MIAIAAGNELAVELVLTALVAIANARLAATEVVHADVFGLEDEPALHGEARLDEIARQLGLTIHGHRAAGEPLQIDAGAPACEYQLEAVMDQALALQALIGPRLAEQLHRA